MSYSRPVAYTSIEVNFTSGVVLFSLSIVLASLPQDSPLVMHVMIIPTLYQLLYTIKQCLRYLVYVRLFLH